MLRTPQRPLTVFLLAAPLLLVDCKKGGTPPPPESTEDPAQPQESAVLPALVPTTAHNVEHWNTALQWQTTDSALARLEQSKKPAMVVVQGQWCPRCRELAQVFDDEEIVTLSKSFEMVLVDTDSAEGERWRETGTYVPRVFFLDSQGQLRTDVLGPNQRYPHFFPAAAKGELLAAMHAVAASGS